MLVNCRETQCILIGTVAESRLSAAATSGSASWGNSWSRAGHAKHAEEADGSENAEPALLPLPSRVAPREHTCDWASMSARRSSRRARLAVARSGDFQPRRNQAPSGHHHVVKTRIRHGLDLTPSHEPHMAHSDCSHGAGCVPDWLNGGESKLVCWERIAVL
jgi:hypothetical protein